MLSSDLQFALLRVLLETLNQFPARRIGWLEVLCAQTIVLLLALSEEGLERRYCG